MECKNGKTSSSWGTLSKGVSQSTVLKSTLFLLFVNDTPKFSSVIHKFLFVQDAYLRLSDNDFKLVSDFNNVLGALGNWLSIKRLSLSFVQKN